RKRDDLIPADRRHAHPRFQEGNFEQNLNLLQPIQSISREKGCTMAQVALAWVLGRGDDIVPIPGTKKRKFLEENVGAVGVSLTETEAQTLDRALPLGAAAGFRYPEFQLKGLGI